MDDPSNLRPPELLLDPMDFLSRSWSVSALEVSEALHLPSSDRPSDPDPLVSGTHFSFSSAATSQLVLERIMSEALPRTCGRLSNSSGPLTSGGGSLSDSPPVSPSVTDEVKYGRAPTGGKHGSRTVGRWLKDRRERKKEEARAHKAELHAAVSVAGVAAAVAAIAAATAAASGTGKDDRAARTDLAVATAATLVASQCVEAAESLGADREHLASVVASAVSVRSPGDIITLTAAAATALRGAATLKARGLKDLWNVAAVTPLDRGQKNADDDAAATATATAGGHQLIPAGNYLGLCSQELLARGAELLKRTRKGSLHWKLVSVYINGMGQVILKMKSSHVAGTFTKKKKSVVVEVCKDVPAWPGRHLLDGGERRRYFGLRTAELRVIEFECKGQRECEMWTEGVARLIGIAGAGGRPSG